MWIEVVEQVSVGEHQGLEYSVATNPFALFLLLGKVLQEVLLVPMRSLFE